MATSSIEPIKTTEPVAVVQFSLQANYGLVIHPYTLTKFNTQKPVQHELDQWTKAQVDAGLLRIV